MVRIGVLSDTHMRSFGEMPQEIVKAFSDMDLIIHAGDFTGLEILEGLKQLGEVKAVRGNMDSSELRVILPENELIVIGSRRIGVTHGAGSPWRTERRIKEMFDEVDIIIYGHTHEAKNEMIGDVLFFNPGPGKKSYGILTVGDSVTGEIIKL